MAMAPGEEEAKWLAEIQQIRKCSSVYISTFLGRLAKSILLFRKKCKLERCWHSGPASHPLLVMLSKWIAGSMCSIVAIINDDK